MTRSPAFQFYPNDFLGSPAVRGMSPTEVGIYVLLLCLDWNGDGFSVDAQNVVSTSRACNSGVRNFKRAWTTIGQCFTLCPDGRYRNPRLQREREKQLAYAERMSANGKLGGRPKAAVKPQLSGEKAAVKPTESIAVAVPSPRTTTTKATTPASPSARGSWMLPASRVWESRFGEGSFPWGEFGKQCKALVKHHPPPTIAEHLSRYLAKTEPQYVSAARFAKTFGEYAPVAAGSLVDEWGVLTEYGDKETRSAGLRIA